MGSKEFAILLLLGLGAIVSFLTLQIQYYMSQWEDDSDENSDDEERGETS